MDKDIIKSVIKELSDNNDSYEAKKIFKDEITKNLDEEMKKFKESGEMFKKKEQNEQED